MGCGATKLQSHVTLPDYHGNVKPSDETSRVRQNNIDNHSTVDDNESDELTQPQVEVADYGQQIVSHADDHDYKEGESYQSQDEKRQVVENQQEQDVRRNQINHQQEEISPRVDQPQGVKNYKQDAAIQQQTDELIDFCDNEMSTRPSNEDNIKENGSADINEMIVNIQTDTCEHNGMSHNNDPITNPQEYCNTARSLSHSPRIVSLQLELGFVNITSTDLDLLTSQWNPKGREEILDVLGINL